MADDFPARFREILDRSVAELVALELEGGVPAATGMIAFHLILRLQSADERERLESLRDEIDDYLEDADNEPPVPFLRVVQ